MITGDIIKSSFMRGTVGIYRPTFINFDLSPKFHCCMIKEAQGILDLDWVWQKSWITAKPKKFGDPTVKWMELFLIIKTE